MQSARRTAENRGRKSVVSAGHQRDERGGGGRRHCPRESRRRDQCGEPSSAICLLRSAIVSACTDILASIAAARPETARSPASACPMWAVDYVAPHHLWRGQTMIAIESSSPANAGKIARPVIQVRSISAAVALSSPKLAHETFAAAASAPESVADIDTVGGHGIAIKTQGQVHV